MQIKSLKIGPIVSVVLLFMVNFFCQTSPVGGVQIVNTNKDIYYEDEKIRVDFSNAPGNEGDWICIVPVGSPDTDGGDYKHMPKGLSQGFLIFDPSSPGKYEVRAYYNYSRNGYVVSGRYAFSVVSDPVKEAAMSLRMERKIDPNNPVETDLPPGQGLVYIFRETFFSSSCEVQIKANEKPVVFMRTATYFLFSVPAGDVNFTTGDIRVNFTSSNAETLSVSECKATIKIKSGYVYYLKLQMIPIPSLALFLDHVPHQEGAKIIESNKLTQIKR